MAAMTFFTASFLFSFFSLFSSAFSSKISPGRWIVVEKWKLMIFQTFKLNEVHTEESLMFESKKKSSLDKFLDTHLFCLLWNIWSPSWLWSFKSAESIYTSLCHQENMHSLFPPTICHIQSSILNHYCQISILVYLCCHQHYLYTMRTLWVSLPAPSTAKSCIITHRSESCHHHIQTSAGGEWFVLKSSVTFRVAFTGCQTLPQVSLSDCPVPLVCLGPATDLDMRSHDHQEE